MDYALFKDKGYPIGSGQIEALNKHVIGTRMKRSGSRSKICKHFSANPYSGFLTSKCTGPNRVPPQWLPYLRKPVPNIPLLT
jgi:hypothetical protein